MGGSQCLLQTAPWFLYCVVVFINLFLMICTNASSIKEIHSWFEMHWKYSHSWFYLFNFVLQCRVFFKYSWIYQFFFYGFWILYHTQKALHSHTSSISLISFPHIKFCSTGIYFSIKYKIRTQLYFFFLNGYVIVLATVID